jgi:hypothetical protein
MLIAIPVAASIKEILDFFYPADGERPHGTPPPPPVASVPLTGGRAGTIPEPQPVVHDVSVSKVDVAAETLAVPAKAVEVAGETATISVPEKQTAD